MKADLSGRPTPVGRWFMSAVLAAVAVGLIGAFGLFGAFSDGSAATPVASPPSTAPAQAGCPGALLVGTLIEHDLWGIAVGGEDGNEVQVIWPAEYGTRRDGDRRALLDESGKVLARTGDRVEIGGGLVGSGDRVWLACGGVIVVEPG